MESIDLNLGKNVLEHWSIPDALREIISNALDEHTKQNIKKLPLIKQTKRNDYYEITDYGTGIKLEDFIQNANTTKVNDKSIIGTFGFGLKDALGVLCKKEINFEIITNDYIYTPQYIKKQRGETLHILVEKNNRRMSDDIGTRFVFKNLKSSDMNKAKQLFLQLNDIPTILYEDKSNNKIFKLEGVKQSIYVNGVKIIDDSKYHFSYDLCKEKSFLTSFNRDRQNIDIKTFNKTIKTILKNIKLFDKNNNISNKDFFDLIKKILTSLKLKEFSPIDVLRSLIQQINSIDKYIFIDKSDKLKSTIIKDKIKKSKREVFVLNDLIKKKFKKNGKKIKNIKELYNNEVFYRSSDKDTKNIFTLLSCESKIIRDQEKIQTKIKKLLQEIKKKLDIHLDSDIEKKLLKIEIDDELDIENEDNENENENEDNENEYKDAHEEVDEIDESESDSESDNEDEDEDEDEIKHKDNNRNIKEGYDFSEDTLKISVKLSENDNKLKAIIIYKYILPNLNESEQLVLFQKLIETTSKTPSWFGWS